MNTLVKSFRPVHSFPSFFDRLLDDVDINSGLTVKIPAVNVSESDEKFEVELAIPGLKKENFHINVENKALVVKGEANKEEATESPKYTRREFSYSSFKRSFNLPKSADTEKIEASYEDGILHISIPKKEEAKPKEPQLIQVK